MIRIEKIRICEFRGIRDLSLDLKNQNFAACGPNGTGKSGIVDAIEFALTGSISRLAGSGTGGLSVKAHGPHVDSRNKPDKASVTLEVVIPPQNRKATIHRTVKDANKPTISPNDPDVVAAFDNVKLHPEFVLSRRELIRYVLSEPGQRAKEVQALLRLDDIEKLRAVLQKIANTCTRELKPIKQADTTATVQLKAALGVAQLTKGTILAAVNPVREILGLPALATMEPNTSLKDGLGTAAHSSAPERLTKLQALTDLQSLKAALEAIKSDTFQKICATANAAAAEIVEDADSLDQLTREELLQSALRLYDEQTCPVCDTPFQPDTFREHIQGKLHRLAEVTAKRSALEILLASAIEIVQVVGTAVANAITLGKQMTPPIDVTPLTDFKAVLGSYYLQMKKVVPIDKTCGALLSVTNPPALADTITELEARIATLPEPSKQDSARDFLILAQERLENFRSARLRLNTATLQENRARKVLEIFGEVTTTALENIYKNVEKTFSEYYREINKDDEKAFAAKLMPSIGKLGFDVDFYGRGNFPPGAYHSEGHQDAMGLCLYLALMNHLFGSGFTFAVLDDVLMSVDSGHRREVCRVLKEKFPQTQFVFTTHDDIWLRHMKSEGLIKDNNFAHFRTWSVDLGPTEWHDRDVWEELETHLVRNDVRAAAALLRHYLEHFSKEACDWLRARVEFRGDAQFALGDLLPNAAASLGSLFRKAKEAANTWNQKDVVSRISNREELFTRAKAKTGVDQWQINAAVHFNAWADLQKADFAPVVEAFKQFTVRSRVPAVNKCCTCRQIEDRWKLCAVVAEI